MGSDASIDIPELERRQRSSVGYFVGWRLIALIALITLLGAALRFWDIGSRALWLDESYSAWFSELGWQSLWFDSPRYETHPPFYYSLLKLWRSVAGDGGGALRGLSGLFGIIAIPVAALAAVTLGRLAETRRPLVLVAAAAVLMALSPRLILIAQDARPYALLLAAHALALTCWLRLALSFRAYTAPDGRLIDWVGLGLGTLLTLWLHFLGILQDAALFGALLLVAAPGASRGRWLRLGVTSAAVLLAYLPCLFMLLGRSGDWSSGWVAWEPAKFPGALLDLYGLYEQTEIFTPIAARILFALLIAAGLRLIWRAGHRSLAGGLTLLILFPPFSAALISQLGQPVFVPRTLVAVLTPAYLVAAFALANMSVRAASISGALTAAILLVNLTETLARPSLEPWDEVAATLEANVEPGDAIWVYPNDSALPLERALHRRAPIIAVPAPFPALDARGSRPAGSPAVVAIDEATARDFAARNAPPSGAVWLVVRNAGLFDPRGEVVKGLAQGRKVGPSRHWRDIDLLMLRPR